MISLKVYRYALIIMIVTLSLVGFYVMVKPKLVKQIKIVIFWYLVILVLNLINILGVLSFYEKNKMRKGPKGYKGLIGSRGLEGNSIMCQSCGLAGISKVEYATSNDIDHDKVKAGRCIFPFIANYQYQNTPFEDSSDGTIDWKTSQLAKFDSDVANLVAAAPTDKDFTEGWCATSVNDQFEPLTIGFVDKNIGNQLGFDAHLAQLKADYQNNMGITELKIISAKGTREAEDIFKTSAFNGFTFIDQDMNDGTGGNYIYLCIKRGGGGVPVITEIVITKLEFDNFIDTPEITASDGWKKVGGNVERSDVELIDLNKGSGSSGELYMYYKKERGDDKVPFIKDIKIQKESVTIPQGFEPLKYLEYTDGEDTAQHDMPKTDDYEFTDKHNDWVDLNRGTHKSDEPKIDKILFLTSTNKNFISVDTAFVYKDGALYMFVGNKFYKFSSQPSGNTLSALDGYPKTIPEKWGRMPSLKDAEGEDGAITVEDCSVYSKEEKKCDSTANCMFDSMNKTCEPKAVYDAAFTDLKGETYLFKGSFVYKYNDKSMKIASGFPKLISNIFEGIPSNLDAVFVWGKDKATYFIKGKLYYKYNNKTDKVERGYPKNVNERWPGMKEVNLINAIFTLPYYVKGTGGENTATNSYSGSNHTYIISANDVYYIHPSRDTVSKIGSIGEVFENIKDLMSPTTSILNLSHENPGKITTADSHGLTTGNKVIISGVTGSNAKDINKQFTITTVIDTDTDKAFTLNGLDTSAMVFDANNGKFQKV
jgi:hypothetical protein